MKTRLTVSMALLLAAWQPDAPAQTPGTNHPSAALMEFLRREGVRDPESGAILTVRPKKPRYHDNPPLGCSIRELPATNETRRYEIVLTAHYMNGNVEHEKIVLDAEPALLREIARMDKHRDLAPERARRLRETRSKRIAEMSNSKLQYGMSKEQIIAIKGEFWEHGTKHQKAGAIEMRYSDMTLFLDPVLLDIYPPGGVVLNDSAPKPVPLHTFDAAGKL